MLCVRSLLRSTVAAADLIQHSVSTAGGCSMLLGGPSSSQGWQLLRALATSFCGEPLPSWVTVCLQLETLNKVSKGCAPTLPRSAASLGRPVVAASWPQIMTESNSERRQAEPCPRRALTTADLRS